jgi:hypothetical protein
MSNAFHAKCAGAEDFATKVARLTDDERHEIASWHKPASFVFHGVELHYASADKELEVCLNSKGEYCLATDPDCVTVGHLDFAWVVEVDGQRVAIVADIKRSEWTSPDGPESLQLHGYALAYSSKVGAQAYVTGQWGAVEGTWWWANRMVDLDGFSELDILGRVLAAAQNVGGDYAMGPHCSGCYGRERCPAYMIGPQDAHDTLAHYTGGEAITNEKAAELLMLVKRVKDMASKVEDELKHRVRTGAIEVSDGNGKVWKPTECQGRLSLSKKLLEADGIQVEKYMERGSSYERWSWCKR